MHTIPSITDPVRPSFEAGTMHGMCRMRRSVMISICNQNTTSVFWQYEYKKDTHRREHRSVGGGADQPRAVVRGKVRHDVGDFDGWVHTGGRCQW